MILDLLKYDPASPTFLSWTVNRGRNAKVGSPAGGLTQGYFRVNCCGKRHMNHRIIWEIHNGEIPEGMEIDHIDNDTMNNDITNLRLSTRSGNVRNRRKFGNGTSSFKGVSWHRPSSKWLSQIAVDGKKKYLGLHETEELAASAYKEAAVKYHCEFAKTE